MIFIKIESWNYKDYHSIAQKSDSDSLTLLFMFFCLPTDLQKTAYLERI
ncbi:hypothetical protein C7382_107148 [Porphyromonas loveana]|uniref:Uncharacterized protein n=1 Tax=Porphyromonas loveana TaxID=1884669 RepID=A0A2U1FF35_9PORP|nr:hypothetical protein C7382_107148 [Porphyromonas loveana]